MHELLNLKTCTKLKGNNCTSRHQINGERPKGETTSRGRTTTSIRRTSTDTGTGTVMERMD